MRYKLVFKEEAAQQTIEAFLWYENKSAGLGESFLTELDVCYGRASAQSGSIPKAIQEFQTGSIGPLSLRYNL